MTDFFNEMPQFANLTSCLTVFEAAAPISLSFILALCIAYLYKKTHTDARYSQSFVQIIIIGDVFIFFGMAVGISCRLWFYILDILFTISLSVIIFVFYLFSFGRSGLDKKSLSITFF